MKKTIVSFLLLFFILPNYASNPDIIVTPEKCLVNSSVYVIFQWRVPYAVEDFNVTVFSDAIEFEESTLYYAGVAEDAKVFHIFEGKAIKPGNHTIKIQMKYFVNGVTVKKKFLANITILSLSEIATKNEVENVSEIDINNITILKNITENVSKNTSIMNSTNISNISINDNNVSLNKTNENVDITNSQENEDVNASNLCTNNETSAQSVQNTQNNSWLIYGIFGLVLGIAFGFVVMYLIKI
ncbi:hypothetical protein JH146_0189 [Methanocaldococcus bathoardescens]|uniref:Uncharacterized protein n=1 Tax=Methanocaldococcus bathoardescens TaxID=1301915 RepID=A0A076L9S3_9EURY|nr:hypothetical protein [Methanocaldococcus bathoardescens]AIJ05040.1 hypothetical protein JH146_0189 [Methanocaldococcus bathoardescens]